MAASKRKRSCALALVVALTLVASTGRAEDEVADPGELVSGRYAFTTYVDDIDAAGGWFE